jgi:hypothetical protein
MAHRIEWPGSSTAQFGRVGCEMRTSECSGSGCCGACHLSCVSRADQRCVHYDACVWVNLLYTIFFFVLSFSYCANRIMICIEMWSSTTTDVHIGSIYASIIVHLCSHFSSYLGICKNIRRSQQWQAQSQISVILWLFMNHGVQILIFCRY